MSVNAAEVEGENNGEMEAGLMKKYCWNGSGNDENNINEMEAGKTKNIGEMEAGVLKIFDEMEAGLMKKYCWNGRDIDEKVLLKWMEAGMMIIILMKWRGEW